MQKIFYPESIVLGAQAYGNLGNSTNVPTLKNYKIEIATAYRNQTQQKILILLY